MEIQLKSKGILKVEVQQFAFRVVRTAPNSNLNKERESFTTIEPIKLALFKIPLELTSISFFICQL
jgi:hypothetical protein